MTVGSTFNIEDFQPNFLDSSHWSGLSSNKFLIIHFWSRSCPACHANMPHLHSLRDRYHSRLQVIAAHRPMNESDLDIDKVRASVVELGVTERCIIDNNHKIGDALEVKAWPTYFLFDSERKLRRRAVGAFGVRVIEQALIRLLEEKTQEAVTETFPVTY
jgi:thiol-disulfide isomerase/thioredoxin